MATAGLPRFEGKQVVGSRIAVYGAGDGLSDALDIEPIALKHGQEGYLVIRFQVRDIDHVPHKKGDYSLLSRKHGLATLQATLVTDDQDELAVGAILAAAAEHVQRAKDSMIGQGRLDDDTIEE